jgi:hypothetical protein
MEYLFCAGLGLLAAAVGVGFIRVLYGTEDLLDRLWRGEPTSITRRAPLPARPVISIPTPPSHVRVHKLAPPLPL